jgi:hypothetical protein
LFISAIKFYNKIIYIIIIEILGISSCRVDGKDPAFFFVFEVRTSKTICWFKELK